jgi:hypothetical protein
MTEDGEEKLTKMGTLRTIDKKLETYGVYAATKAAVEMLTAISNQSPAHKLSQPSPRAGRGSGSMST